MNFFQRLFIFCLAFKAGAAAPAGKPIEGIMNKLPVYTAAERSIEAEPGTEFAISLDSNPTTGYSWDFSSPPDPEVVELLDAAYQPPETPRVGAGGKQLWTFRAAGPGETEIALDYFRPWEEGAPPARTAVFTVVVREGNR